MATDPGDETRVVATDPTTEHSASSSRLREARSARGLSQQQIARLVGVSRQAVAALESGRSEPSLRLALALAESLGLTVEELFGASDHLPTLEAAPLGALGLRGARVGLAAVGSRLVALPRDGAAGVRTGFSPAGALVVAGPSTVRPLAPVRPTVVVAGCDPALSLLETPLAHLEPSMQLAWRHCGSAEALDLAARGLVHAAGIHVLDAATGAYNLAAARSRLGGADVELVGFSRWRQGLVVRPDLSEEVRTIGDVARLRLRLIRREKGSEARTLLERAADESGVQLADLPGGFAEVDSHLAVAACVAAGLADVGVASEPVALAYGLGFSSLSSERFDLAIATELASGPEVQALLRVLRSPWLRGQLTSIPGYDATTCGAPAGPG